MSSGVSRIKQAIAGTEEPSRGLANRESLAIRGSFRFRNVVAAEDLPDGWHIKPEEHHEERRFFGGLQNLALSGHVDRRQQECRFVANVCGPAEDNAFLPLQKDAQTRLIGRPIAWRGDRPMVKGHLRYCTRMFSGFVGKCGNAARERMPAFKNKRVWRHTVFLRDSASAGSSYSVPPLAIVFARKSSPGQE
jgi:hypothetical protein